MGYDGGGGGEDLKLGICPLSLDLDEIHNIIKKRECTKYEYY
jgi:hypothetical protein